MSELVWRRSSACEGGACVEVATGAMPVAEHECERCESGACVEVAFDGNEYHVRNSREPEVKLRFTVAEWEAFVAGALAGEFPAPVG